MRLKRLGVFLVGLFLIIAFLGVISAAVSCSVVPSASCTGTKVMGLSDLTNAHGESSGTYPYVLCCSGGGSTICSGTSNKILGLSSSTNAHAEIPSLNTYLTPVCYGNLECSSQANTCLSGYDIQMISLSDNTNAHIGNFSAYNNVKICCKEGAGPPPSTPDAYWSGNSNGVGTISSISVNVGITTVYMVVTGQTPGEVITFTIKEENTGIIPDDTIAIKTATVGSSGNAIAGWQILQEDLDKSPGEDYDYFYFKTGVADDSDGLSMTTGYCPLDIPLCSSYDEAHCANDPCDIASSDGAARQINCDEPGKDCRCIWDATDGCEFAWNGTAPNRCGNNVVGSGEECDGNPPGAFDWGAIARCTDFDAFTGGILTCGNDCKFDTSLCIGVSGGFCGDGVINTGETCDGTNMSGKTCTDFDEFISGGDLSCGANCNFNTSKCEKDPNDPESWGSCEGMDEGLCKYNDNVNDANCDDGFFGYSWNANWTWNPLNDLGSTMPSNWDNPSDLIFDTSANVYRCNTTSVDCHDGSATQACPAKIELPFFGLMNFVIAVIAIALIYVALNQKKRKH